MTLRPNNRRHRLQIEAGTTGRNRGHKFEGILAHEINCLDSITINPQEHHSPHVTHGNPAMQLLQYISNNEQITINGFAAYWVGGLATSGQGDTLIDTNGNPIKKCKSDVVIKITDSNNNIRTVGVSVKTCNKKTPTNDQLFFTTATAFCQLLRNNDIAVSDYAEYGMRMFCGDTGYRPLDLMTPEELQNRISDPNRYYWEEMTLQAQQDWKTIFTENQDKITRLLLQKAYNDDPFPPDYLLHQTCFYENFNCCETAIFTIDEIISLSKEHQGYTLSEYKIKKGTHRNDNNTHYAPRFGFVQFQRGGQKQHPSQLQFNLKAGYFRHI